MREVKGKCIAFANHKGGTGKTTSCINTAGELVKHGKKVLVVDLDPQGNATSGLGIDKNKIDACMLDVLQYKCGVGSEKPLKDVILNTGIENLDIAPATLELSGIVTLIHKAENPTSLLKEAVEPVKEMYDFILVDSPPSYGYLMINAISASDGIVVPLDSGAFTLDSIKSFATLLRDIQDELGMNVNIHGVTLTVPQGSLHYKFSYLLSRLIPSYRYLSADAEDRIRVFLSVNNLFMESLYVIPYSKKIYEAQLKGMPLSHYDPGNEINKAYQGIVQRIL